MLWLLVAMLSVVGLSMAASGCTDDTTLPLDGAVDQHVGSDLHASDLKAAVDSGTID